MTCPPDQVKTPNELAGLAIAAGMTPKTTALAVSVAIALAESGGCPTAVSSTNDYGLWQVNIPTHPEYTADQMYDPSQNAGAMFKISNGGRNWTPWTTYNNGAYLAYLPAGKVGADSPINPGQSSSSQQDLGPAGGGLSDIFHGAPGVGTLTNIWNGIKDIGNIIQIPIKAGQWVVKNIRRVIEGMLGIAAIVVGIIMINEDTFQGVASKVASAVPSGS
jgi:hypothetical protein